MSFALYYASKAHMKITRVTMLSELDAREWFGKCQQWSDVVRIRMTNEATGEVVQDIAMPARIEDPNDPAREEAVRELCERMDRVFAPDRMVRRADPETSVSSSLSRNTIADERCACGHLRVEHNGAEGSGYCHAGCVARCQRFRRR